MSVSIATRAGAAAMALMLAACGGGEPAAPVAANMTDPAGLNFQAEVAGLTEAGRKAVLIRAIRDAGLPCEGVATATETAPGSFVYAATCIDGPKHQVAIEADGDARVTGAR